MMKTYARVEDGVIQEIIEPFADPNGNEYSIEERFVPELVVQMIDITGVTPKPDQMWTYDGAVFAAPVPYQPTPEEILAGNLSTRDVFLSKATMAIAPLQDAVDLEDATPTELAQLKSWKQYRIAVNRVDLTQGDPAWPPQP
jgi:hypothetical protein